MDCCTHTWNLQFLVLGADISEMSKREFADVYKKVCGQLIH